MAVDLGNLIESLEREINPPGSDLFPNDTEDILLGYLQDAFWEARLDGFFEGFTEDGNGSVTPVSGTTDMERHWQQLIVFYAGLRIVRNALRDQSTLFRAKAGPVEFEQQNSAQLLRDVFAELRQKRNYLLEYLSDIGAVTPGYVDMIMARDDSMGYGSTEFVNSRLTDGWY